MLEIGQQNLEINMDFESSVKYAFGSALTWNGKTTVGWYDPFDAAGC